MNERDKLECEVATANASALREGVASLAANIEHLRMKIAERAMELDGITPQERADNRARALYAVGLASEIEVAELKFEQYETQARQMIANMAAEAAKIHPAKSTTADPEILDCMLNLEGAYGFAVTTLSECVGA